MLREIWLNIGVKKLDTHKGIIIKALLDSGSTGMFINRKIAAKHEFRLQKLKRLTVVRNMNRTKNSTGAITYQVTWTCYLKVGYEQPVSSSLSC